MNWINSYLTGRKQKVYIDGALSEALPVTVGVPQGSILGPLLYIIYTSDLPSSVHTDMETSCAVNCTDCGSLCCYADDSTFSIAGCEPARMTEKNCRQVP